MGPGGKENKGETLFSIKVSQKLCPNAEESSTMPRVAGTPCPLPAPGSHTLERTGPWGLLHSPTRDSIHHFDVLE